MKDKSKTKKNKPTPLISPNVMKRNLLQKIKEHKDRNTSNISHQTDTNKNESNMEIGKFSSDFQDSMNYLKELTKKPIIKPNKNTFGNTSQIQPQIPPQIQPQFQPQIQLLIYQLD